MAWLVVPLAAQAGGDRHLSGEIRLEQSLTVPRGERLTIAPGSVIRVLNPAVKIDVYGEIFVQGSSGQPVTFQTPAGWKGIELFDGVTESRFSFVEIRGAETGISSTSAVFSVRHGTFRDCATAVRLLRESAPVIEESLFEGNRIGIDSEMKSQATIRRNLFRAHAQAGLLLSHNSGGRVEKNRFENNQLGIDVMQTSAAVLVGNRFVANQTALHCYQTQTTPVINANFFHDNNLGIDNVSFSSPEISGNTFTRNRVALRNDQLGNGPIRHNLFRDNKTAIYNNRKSSPAIEHNCIETNDLAIFCDYSSYPTIHHNNFSRNALAVKLGIFQSGDWERRAGAGAPARREASEQKRRNPQLAKALSEVHDEVDASNNWWGEETARLRHLGSNGNLPIFYDRHDQPLVVYEGFGLEHYALDTIRFAPWLTTQVPACGPQP